MSRRLVALYRSQLGKKVVVAVTGLIMVGFLVVHLAGNLKVFLPDPEPGVADIDVYAEALREIGVPFLPHGAVVWATRLALLAAVILHVVCVLQLSAQSRAARRGGYAERRYQRATWAARLMMVSGLTLLVYIVFHLAHLTVGVVEPDRFVHGALYYNLYEAFTRWPFVLIYTVGMAAVAFHVYHGAWSVFQTLGLDSPERNRLFRGVAIGLAILFLVGFLSIPFAFVSGVLGPPPSPPEEHAGILQAGFATPADNAPSEVQR
ncbi:MAG: succinate dehydrogenase [Acidobacteria bacterium]|nr:MAG: succinate dehydrogenase [Acidobacteriota bacterium]REK03685.1 MAG: succinate dehydrogenase [Acidobacteriota bacterium]